MGYHHAAFYILSVTFLSAFHHQFGLGVRAQQNITLDDGDSSIVYAPPGAWIRSEPSPLDVGGSHMLTQDPNGTASFNFTGVAVYFFSPKWPYLVGVAIALDGAVPEYVDLVDHLSPDQGQGPETVPSQVVWSATGLEDGPHSLVVSVPQGQPYAVFDGLTFTDSRDAPLLSSTATPSFPSTMTSTATDTPNPSSTADTPTSATSKPRVRGISIAFGVIFGIIALLIIALAVWRYLRHKRRPLSEAWTAADPSSTAGSRPPSVRKSMFGGGFGNRKSLQPTPFIDPPPAPPPPAHGYYMEQREDGQWSNPQYGYVGTTPAPPLSAYSQSSHPTSPLSPSSHYSNGSTAGQYTTVPQPYYYPGSVAVDPYVRAPNRYEPGNTLSTITEKSTPGQSGGYGNRTLPNSPDSTRTLDLAGRTPASNLQRQLSDHKLAPVHEPRSTYSTIPQPYPSAPASTITDGSSYDAHSTATGHSSADSKRPLSPRKPSTNGGSWQ